MNGKLSCQYCSGPTNLQNGKLGDGFYVLCYCGRSGPTRDSAAQAIGDWSMGKETAEERDALKEKVAALEADKAELWEALRDNIEQLKKATDLFFQRGAFDIGAASRDSANRSEILLRKHNAEKGRDDE